MQPRDQRPGGFRRDGVGLLHTVRHSQDTNRWPHHKPPTPFIKMAGEPKLL